MFTILQIVLLIVILWQIRNIRATVNGLDDLVEFAYNGGRYRLSGGKDKKGGKYDA